MGLKAFIIKPYAQWVAAKVKRWSQNPIERQERLFTKLVEKAKYTAFGKDHGFSDISSYHDFQKQVPIRDYEQLAPYIERIKKGEPDVLWAGRPRYFAKTSGTTSGTKYIPITNDSIGNHFFSAQTAMMLYMAETGNYNIMDGKMIFLSGSPELEKVGGIPTGRLSGIVNHEVPSWLRTNQLPSWTTNCIDDWEQKLDKIVEETLQADMTLISGIPPWVQMYFDRLVAIKGNPIKDVFPNFKVLVYGGVNFEPYKAKMMSSIGKTIDSVETYPASEGFLAYQDSQRAEGLLLNVDSGIFFEFIPASEYYDENPSRLSLADVKLGVNYALIINSNAGLWAYSIGDTVKFVSLKPYRLVVTGRIKHFISAFGEHVIGEEVEKAMADAVAQIPAKVTEFTVAPKVEVQAELPYHEWLVEFDEMPSDIDKFANLLNQSMQRQNIYYADLIEGRVLQPLKITMLKKDAFIAYMRTQGKLGGQNKVPRLSNDRRVADALEPYIDRV
ncbi:MAG: GH3 auxin-responsive promoter family protein [Chitinophagales bacterium]|nr:GH3 auxin-responsive promoter family protein [Chitinophagales bacterium]